MKLRLEQDTDAQAPNEFDDTICLIANHRDFFVPPARDIRNFDVGQQIRHKRHTCHVFLLEAYIHSGVVLALAGEGNFPDRQWDVSLLGAIFVPKTEARQRKSAHKLALGKVEEWNQYLSGDVWGCIVEDDDGNHLDSCWGFYGREYAEQEGARMLAYCQQHAQSQACEI